MTWIADHGHQCRPSCDKRYDLVAPRHRGTIQTHPKLEEVFADLKCQLTSVAVSARGRVFTNYPVWSPIHQYGVVEIVAGRARPYPDEAMNH